ncbi:hypothetical protein GCM10007100_36100 [Roseibacillus persicicus]|uniref:Uncharacterized protein n=1 Tax=Roseibacillus persicicus TaxID=454148 RepID=A0A918WPY5_9BACT|nr:hypothetical protein GCM10007100_36100 [Roseibacillus persicicus]
MGFARDDVALAISDRPNFGTLADGDGEVDFGIYEFNRSRCGGKWEFFEYCFVGSGYKLAD